MTEPTHTLAQAAAKLDVRNALRVLQTEMRRRFGKDDFSILGKDIGQNTISISPHRIEVTDENCHIVARGPARVATVLVRRRRKKKTSK